MTDATAGHSTTGGPGPGAVTLADVCVVACAEAWRGDGAILASPMGLIPTLGARLAQLTFEPDLLLTDGEAYLLTPGDAPGEPNGPGERGQPHGPGERGEPGGPGEPSPPGRERLTEGWLPYRSVFTLVAAGRRHVMMGASQLDRYGNQNISCIGDWTRPKAQLLGVRGAPGNTINHPVSYWLPRHSPRVLVDQVDMVCGLGYDRAAALGPPGNRFHEVRLVVTDLAVLDFATPDRAMRLRSVHPGVAVGAVVAATGFPLTVPDPVPRTRWPTPGELALLKEIDPGRGREQELRSRSS